YQLLALEARGLQRGVLRPVVLVPQRPLLRRQVVRRLELQVAREEVPRDLHLLQAERRRATGAVVPERRRLGEQRVTVERQLVRAGVPEPVRRIEIDREQERSVMLPALQPGERTLGNDLLRCARVPYTVCGRVQRRVVVRALPRQDFVVVEPLRRGPQVPLPEDRSAVAGAPQQLRE